MKTWIELKVTFHSNSWKLTTTSIVVLSIVVITIIIVIRIIITFTIFTIFANMSVSTTIPTTRIVTLLLLSSSSSSFSTLYVFFFSFFDSFLSVFLFLLFLTSQVLHPLNTHHITLYEAEVCFCICSLQLLPLFFSFNHCHILFPQFKSFSILQF